MLTWIPISLAAATAQTVRFMLQKHLKSTRLSTAGATFSRFIYSAPLVAILFYLYAKISGQGLPQTSVSFWVFALGGGLSQILATLCVVALFAERNFAVGITFKKTEVLQTAIVGYLVLGDTPTPLGAVAIMIGFAAVLLLADPPKGTYAGPAWKRFFNRAAGLGILSGILFGFSAVGYRGASLGLEGGNVALRAGFTLAVVVASQSIAMGTWLLVRDRQEILAVIAAWRVAALVGVTSMTGSFLWFVAFTLQNASYVKAVGQVELVFSVMASVLFFKEKITTRELGGIALLLVSILGLVLTISA
ncbi:MAG: EamA family transporter [Paracoccaceae bacterium]